MVFKPKTSIQITTIETVERKVFSDSNSYRVAVMISKYSSHPFTHKPTVKRMDTDLLANSTQNMEVFAIPKRSAYVIHASEVEAFENHHRSPAQIEATRKAAQAFKLNNLKLK